MEILVLKLLLVASNFALLSYLIMIMLYHYQHHYDMKSWASLFHVTSASWLLIRGSFWISTCTSYMKWNSNSFYLLYWIPNMFEFSAFMILPLYFTQVLYPSNWNQYWIHIRPVYFGILACIIAFEVIWSFLLEPKEDIYCNADDMQTNECFHTENSTSTFRVITMVCFLFLSIIQYAFGIKILQIDEQRYKHFLTTPRKILANVNNILVLCFATRAIYQLFAINELYVLPDVPLDTSDGDVDISVFLVSELWMYLPTWLIVQTITSQSFGQPVTNSAASHILSSYYRAIPSYGSTMIGDDEGVTNALTMSHLNSNDEEDEKTIIKEGDDHFDVMHDVASRDASFRKTSKTIPIHVAPPSDSNLYSSSWANMKYNSLSSSNSGNSFAAPPSNLGSGGNSVLFASHVAPPPNTSTSNTAGSHTSNSWNSGGVSLLSSYIKQTSLRDNSMGSGSQASSVTNVPFISNLHQPSLPGSNSIDLQSQSYSEGSPMRQQDSSAMFAPSSLPNPSPGSSFAGVAVGSYSKGLSPHRAVRCYNESTATTNTNTTAMTSASGSYTQMAPMLAMQFRQETQQPSPSLPSLPLQTSSLSRTVSLTINPNEYELQIEPNNTSSPESETAAPEQQSAVMLHDISTEQYPQLSSTPEEGRFFIGSYEQNNMHEAPSTSANLRLSSQSLFDQTINNHHPNNNYNSSPHPFVPRPKRINHVASFTARSMVMDHIQRTSSSDSDTSNAVHSNPSSYPQTFSGQLTGFPQRNNLASPNSQTSSMSSSPFVFLPPGYNSATTTYYYSSPGLIANSSPHPNTHTALLAPNSRLVHSASANGSLSAKSLTPERREAMQEALQLRESLRNRPCPQMSPSVQQQQQRQQQQQQQQQPGDHHHTLDSRHFASST